MLAFGLKFVFFSTFSPNASVFGNHSAASYVKNVLLRHHPFSKTSGGFSKKVGRILFLPSDGNNLIRLFHQNLLPFLFLGGF